jgi:hypothetical protein
MAMLDGMKGAWRRTNCPALAERSPALAVYVREFFPETTERVARNIHYVSIYYGTFVS